MRQKRSLIRIKLAALCAVIALLAIGLLNLQSLLDFARLYNYQPPQEVVTLADQTTMTDSARKYFYVNHPQVASRSVFNQECNSRGEQTIVLGCYHAVNRGIYLYKVTDARLNGVEQVTAAHEMLHAGYDRLGKKDKQAIDGELQAFFASQVSDERIRNTIAAYKKTEPNDLVNEMHSIFATEIVSLTPALEKYYATYFNDRQKVVGFANVYQKEFTDRQEKVKQYDARLTQLKQSIDTNSASLKQREVDIQSMQRQMEAYRTSGNDEEYNAQVPVYNARINVYNGLIRTTQNQINEYNRLVAERNSIATEVRQLTQSIDSQLSPINE